MGYGAIASALFACTFLYMSTNKVFEEAWRKFFLYYGLANIPITFGFLILDSDPIKYAVAILLVHALVGLGFIAGDLFFMLNWIISKVTGK